MSDTIPEVVTQKASGNIEVTIHFLCNLKWELKRRCWGGRTDENTGICQRTRSEERVILFDRCGACLIQGNVIRHQRCRLRLRVRTTRDMSKGHSPCPRGRWLRWREQASRSRPNPNSRTRRGVNQNGGDTGHRTDRHDERCVFPCCESRLDVCGQQ